MIKEVDITNVRLETQRCVLRPFNENDLNDFYDYAHVEGVGELAGWNHHQTIEESKNILNMFISNHKTFAIVDKHSNKVIGSIGIEEFDEEEFIESPLYGRELGYVLSKEYWGKGIMPEAALRVLQYMFDDLKLDFVLCAYFKRNSQSKRVQEKLGFKHYKDIMYHTFAGNDEDSVCNIMYKEDYYKCHNMQS